MMKKVLLTCFALLIAISPVDMALAGRRQQSTKKEKEETLLGTVSCMAAAAKAPTPAPAGNGATPGSGPNAATPAVGINGALPGPGTVAPPRINTVRDCLANGGKVVIRPDAGHGDIPIENPEAIKGHEWHRVSISGYMNGSSFHIMSLRSI